MYVPMRLCEELLNNQFGSTAHTPHPNQRAEKVSDSFLIVMATHNRTAQASAALKAACAAASSTARLLETVVYIDEAPSDGTRTELALSEGPQSRRFLHGDGNTYWSRAFHVLLTEAMRSNADYIVHLNTDVTISAPIDVLLEPMREDPRVAAVAGTLVGGITITGYKSVRPWFPFFRSVAAGEDAAFLPASCIAYRTSALRSLGPELTALDAYRHGWADIELSMQLRDAGFKLATTSSIAGRVEHTRYYRREHSFDRYHGSLVEYVRDCPTAPCFADTKRVGTRLFGRLWPVMLRVYVPVGVQWLRYKVRRKPERP